MSRPTTDARRDAESRGRSAEWLAAWVLRFKGYRILARDFRCATGEIDLIARRGRTLAFVEVKARSDFSAAAEAVTLRQRDRIARAALFFLQRRPALAGLDVRFDVVWVPPRQRPRHIADAWRPEL